MFFLWVVVGGGVVVHVGDEDAGGLSVDVGVDYLLFLGHMRQNHNKSLLLTQGGFNLAILSVFLSRTKNLLLALRKRFFNPSPSN